MIAGQFQVVHARATGLDVHKMEITATVLFQAAALAPKLTKMLTRGLPALNCWRQFGKIRY